LWQLLVCESCNSVCMNVDKLWMDIETKIIRYYLRYSFSSEEITWHALYHVFLPTFVKSNCRINSKIKTFKGEKVNLVPSYDFLKRGRRDVEVTFFRSAYLSLYADKELHLLIVWNRDRCALSSTDEHGYWSIYYCYHRRMDFA
jgi:hypothetical protein